MSIYRAEVMFMGHRLNSIDVHAAVVSAIHENEDAEVVRSDVRIYKSRDVGSAIVVFKAADDQTAVEAVKRATQSVSGHTGEVAVFAKRGSRRRFHPIERTTQS